MGGRRGGEASAVHSRVCTCPCGVQRFVYKGVVHDLKRHLGFSRVGRIFFHGAEKEEAERFDRFPPSGREDFHGTTEDDSGP